MNHSLRRFLATHRWQALFAALRTEAEVCPVPRTGVIEVLLALLIALLPLPFVFLADRAPSTQLDLATVALGTATLLAIVFRSRFRVIHPPVRSWSTSFSLTHTAFALGCVPAALILLLAPHEFAQHQEFIREHVSSGERPVTSGTLDWILMGATLVGISLWASVTEEIIYRGLMVSVLRRANIAISQNVKDLATCVFGGIIFGLVHYPTWGLAPSIALAGLGFGFSLGFIANGERLAPLIVYHFAFDLISMLVSLFGPLTR